MVITWATPRTINRATDVNTSRRPDAGDDLEQRAHQVASRAHGDRERGDAFQGRAQVGALLHVGGGREQRHHAHDRDRGQILEQQYAEGRVTEGEFSRLRSFMVCTAMAVDESESAEIPRSALVASSGRPP